MIDIFLITNTVKKKALTFFAALSIFLLLTCASFAQTKGPIEGVWKISAIVIPAKNSTEKDTTLTNPQPGLIIFTKGYYSTVVVHEERPAVAAAKDPQNMTDAEKLALYTQWKPFTANSGTYQINGSTITRKSIVAKNANAMTRGAPNIQEFKLEDPNTLWLLPTAGAPANEPRIKLTRLE